MISKHLIKTIVTFFIMIVVGLVGVFLVSYFDDKKEDVETLKSNKISIAK